MGDRYKQELSGNLELFLAMIIQETKPLSKKGRGVLFEWKRKSQPVFESLCKTTLNAQHAVGKPPLTLCLSVRNHLDI